MIHEKVQLLSRQLQWQCWGVLLHACTGFSRVPGAECPTASVLCAHAASSSGDGQLDTREAGWDLRELHDGGVDTIHLPFSRPEGLSYYELYGLQGPPVSGSGPSRGSADQLTWSSIMC